MTLDERPILLGIQHVPWEGPHRILDACGALRVKTVKPLAGQPLPAHGEALKSPPPGRGGPWRSA